MTSRSSQNQTVSPLPSSLHCVGEQRPRRLSKEGIGINESSHRLNLDAHHRWRATKAVKFLRTIGKIGIETTHTRENDIYFVVEVDTNPSTSLVGESQFELRPASGLTTYHIERCFSDFEELRENISAIVNTLPPCRCAYCIDFLLYIRFNSQQPRGIVKIVGTTEKRKQVLAMFINNLVHMGRRRTQQNTSKRGCKAQSIVPTLIEAFLVDSTLDIIPTLCSESFSRELSCLEIQDS